MEEIHTKNENWVNILKVTVPYFVVALLFQFSGLLLLGLQFQDIRGDLTSLQTLVITVCNLTGTFLVVWLARKYIDHAAFSSLGFKTFYKTDVFWGVLIGFMIMLTGYLLLLGAGQIRYLNSNFVFYDFILGLLSFVLVAFAEEVLIRGYVLTNLMGSMNRYTALIVSSLIFSLMHLGNSNYGWVPGFELFLAGILLGLSYLYTRNLWFPVALHFSWNFFQATVFGFNVSGRHVYGIISHVRSEDNIWNGGAFGFEGSVLSLILQVIAILVIYLLFHQRTREIQPVC